MRRIAAALLLSASGAFGQSGLTVPLAGTTASPSGRSAPVYGIAGNFVVGAPWELDRVEYAGRHLLAHRRGGEGKGELLVLALDGEVVCRHDAPVGAVRFGLSASGEEALAWFEEAAQLQFVNLGGCTAQPLEPDPPVTDPVIALGFLAGGRIGLVVRRPAGVFLLELSPAGRLENEAPLADVTQPLALLRDGTLAFAEREFLVLRAPGGGEVRLSAGARVLELSEMGPGWLSVTLDAPQGRRAVRVRGGEPEWYYLPEVVE